MTGSVSSMTTTERVRHRFTVDDYHRMGESGVFGPEDRVELLDGEVIEMSPIGSRHAGTVNRLTELFLLRLTGKINVSPQNSMALSNRSEPEPDLVLLRRRPDFYADALPTPGDVLLLVEVADTSVGFDRGFKMPLYAAAGINEAWLVDLPAGIVEVYREPSASGYASIRQARAGESLSLLAFGDVSFDLAEILP